MPSESDKMQHAEFAFLQGGLLQVKVQLVRCLTELEPAIQKQIAVEAGIQVQNMLAEAHQRNALIQDTMDNGRGLRIARP